MKGRSSHRGCAYGSILTLLFTHPLQHTRTHNTLSSPFPLSAIHFFARYTTAGKDVALAEVGPRWEMKLYSIKLGTVADAEADVEFVARPYINTAKKNKVLAK